jgi:hypothetical protein
MGLDAKIKASVDKAFRKIDDILSTVVFSNQSTGDFDFATGQVVSTTTTISTRGYVMKRKVVVDGIRVTRLTLLLKTEGYVFNGYTTVSVSGSNYKCSVLESDAYVTTLLIEGLS